MANIAQLFNLDPKSWRRPPGPRPKLRDQILAAARPGMLARQVADAAGASVSYTTKIMCNAGLIKSRLCDLIITTWHEGTTIREIAATTGASYKYTATTLVNADLPIRKIVGRRSMRHDHSRVIEEARRGPNLSAAAARLGLSRERVRQIVDRHERETNEYIARPRHQRRRHTVR